MNYALKCKLGSTPRGKKANVFSLYFNQLLTKKLKLFKFSQKTLIVKNSLRFESLLYIIIFTIIFL
jgi:hypothetical protein